MKYMLAVALGNGRRLFLDPDEIESVEDAPNMKKTTLVVMQTGARHVIPDREATSFMGALYRSTQPGVVNVRHSVVRAEQLPHGLDTAQTISWRSVSDRSSDTGLSDEAEVRDQEVRAGAVDH